MSDQSPYKYNEWINLALLDVIKKTIKTLSKQGLYQEIHFYITFNTNDKLVVMPDYLKSKYPETMTIVLQNQFYDIQIDNRGFSVVLSFNGKTEKLYLSWSSIIQVLDPVSPISLQIDQNFINKEATSKEQSPELEKAVTSKNNVIKFPKK
ncbi:ClpXP protease specificity-enhancing factor SspB [Rickettsiales bacterium LUAb2]